MGMFHRVRRGLASAQQWLSSISPPKLFGGYLFFAILMFLLTEAASLGRITFEIEQPPGEKLPREKGYWWELNWGLNHLAAIPLALFCSAWLLQSIHAQVRRLASARMAVDEHFEPLTEDQLLRDWRRYEIGPVFFGVLAVVPFVASYAEWWAGSARPILAHDSVGRQFGWTTGALLAPEQVVPWVNIALSFVAFTAQGFVATVFAYVFATVVCFSSWVYNYGGPVGPRLIPNLKSEDSRRGFQVFEPIVYRLLYVGLAFTVVLFFIRVQSVYDYSGKPAKTVFHFILEDVIQGFVANAAELLQGKPTDLFDVGNATNFGTGIVLAAMSVMVTVIVAVPTLILSVLARQSRESLRECLASAECPPCRSWVLTPVECEQKMEKMDFWPLRYPRPMGLIAYIVFAGFCFVFYKFTFVLLGILVIQTVRVVYRALTTPPVPDPEK